MFVNDLDPKMLMVRTHIGVTPVERFWKYVIKSDYCWNWNGFKNEFGYGRMSVGRIMHVAHRISWTIYFGHIPQDKRVLHQCDNRACVNPFHLFLGTQKDNMHDCIDKHRMKMGEDRPAAKLTEQEVRDIRKYFSVFGVRKCQLARRYGISDCEIHQIIAGTKWKHILSTPCQSQLSPALRFQKD